MAVESVEQSIVSSLLPVSATATSIYVVVLVFVFGKYQELEYNAAPKARIYFLSGIILILSFSISGLSTIWLLALELGIVSSQPILATYALGVSFIFLILGNLIIGYTVILSDLSKWCERLDEWAKRKCRHSTVSTSLLVPSSYNLFIFLGILIILSGVFLFQSTGPRSIQPAALTFLLGVAILIYGRYVEKDTYSISGFVATVVLIALLEISVMVSHLLSQISIWIIFLIYLTLSFGVFIGHRVAIDT